MKIYKVGGCVRDALMGLKSKDIDFTYVSDNLKQSSKEGFLEMFDYLRDSGFNIFLSNPECYTIRAKFPENHENKGMVADFVLARKELGYHEDSRKPKLAIGSLEDDLERRDFTINAIAEDEESRIIDPFNGCEDIKKRLLRTPIDTEITMMDDPLRLLRAFRFKITKGFYFTDDIWLCVSNTKILMKLSRTVSQERIREELNKMFKHDTKATLELLEQIRNVNDDLIDIIFSKGLWLKPSFEQ